MFVQSERDLENYICEHIDRFKGFLGTIYGEDKEFSFIGRQVNVCGKFIDLLFDFWENPNTACPLETRTFVVIELKNRDLCPNDLAQISRYINILDEYYEYDKEVDYEIDVNGILIGMDLDDNMQEIEVCMGRQVGQRIKFVGIESDLVFKEADYYHSETFLENLEFDKRIKAKRE